MSSIALLLVLSACAGRTPNPIASKRSFDSNLSCLQIKDEYANNRTTIDRLYQEDQERQERNAAMAALTLVAGVAVLAAMDTGEAQDVETEALLKRNLNLSAMADRKGCEPLTPSMDDVAARVAAEKASKAAAEAAREEARKQAEEQR